MQLTHPRETLCVAHARPDCDTNRADTSCAPSRLALTCQILCVLFAYFGSNFFSYKSVCYSLRDMGSNKHAFLVIHRTFLWYESCGEDSLVTYAYRSVAKNSFIYALHTSTVVLTLSAALKFVFGSLKTANTASLCDYKRTDKTPAI